MLEDGGGHWNECWIAGLNDASCVPDGVFNDLELMTPFAVDVPATISAATIAAFRDLGYLTIDPFANVSIPLAANIPPNMAVPVPATSSLLFAALFGIYISRRRRNS